MTIKKWIGFYQFVHEYDKESKSFDFELIVADNQGSFEGYTVEDFFRLAGEFPIIRGFIEDDHISFVKTYPFRYLIDVNGDLHFDESKQGHEVVYDGYFNDTENRWEGQWKILVKEIRISNGRYESYYSKGYWQMQFADPESPLIHPTIKPISGW